VTAALASALELTLVARALHAQSVVLSLARELDWLGIPVLALKGPWLQQRLYGTPAAYPSGDVDLLVPRDRAQQARRAIARAGWRFERENSVLWFLSGAASYARHGVRVDLHWGVHAAHLPSWALRSLEGALWAGARPGAGELLEPDVESLFVFLAVHAVGHAFQRDAWMSNVAACAQLVRDWERVWRIAREACVDGAVAAALRSESSVPPLLGGWAGQLVWRASWLARGHFIPRVVRDRIRAAVGVGRAVLGSGARAGPSR
jgi:hypothetical protein